MVAEAGVPETQTILGASKKVIRGQLGASGIDILGDHGSLPASTCINEVRLLMGHTTVTTTEIYAHLQPQKLHGTIGLIAEEKGEESGSVVEKRLKLVKAAEKFFITRLRGVAQPGRASALGAEGRWFESSRPDHP